MTYIIDFEQPMPLKIICENEREERTQLLYTLLNTYIAEVPCYRQFGLDQSFLSMPINVAKSMLVSAVADAIGKFIPDLRIEKVGFTVDPNHPDKLSPRIEVVDNESES